MKLSQLWSKKQKISPEQKLAANGNSCILIRQNGEKIYYPKIDGLTINFLGQNSVVEIHEPCSFFNCTFNVGDHNFVCIDKTQYIIRNFNIASKMREGSKVIVGEDLSCEGCNLYMHDEPNTTVRIGRDCMFSFDIIIWPSDGHAIVSDDGHPLNAGMDIEIGNHVWIGMQNKILKGARIPDNSVIGACSVFLKGTFPKNPDANYASKGKIFAGNPAKPVKEGNFHWTRVNCYEYQAGWGGGRTLDTKFP